MSRQKDAAEVSALEFAARAIDAVHAQVPALLASGRTEDAVAADLSEAILASGHVAVDFVIVASGPHGADPHHEHSQRQLRPGDLVVVDIGGTTAAEYHSDCTRTYLVGGGGPVEAAADPDALAAWASLAAAQAAARAAVRPGRTASDIDRVAREHLTADGYGEFFIHRTGHGIGLSVHEEPFITATNDLVLTEGMAFSIEPGIYLPGRWGMRLEDIVVVTADGGRSLNRADRSLIVGQR